MPTMRSPFKIEQYEQVLQKLAHECPRFKKVSTADITLAFSYTQDGKPRRISVQYHRRTGNIHCWSCHETFTEEEFQKHIDEKHNDDDYYGNDEIDYWSFSIEAKNYMNSADATKLSYGSEQTRKKMESWLKDIMGSLKPEPRFSLREHAEQLRRRSE